MASTDIDFGAGPNTGDTVREALEKIQTRVASAPAAQQLFDAGLINAPTVEAMADYLKGTPGEPGVGLPSLVVTLSSLADADAKLVPYITATAGSPIINAPVAIFAESDVGKRIKVAGVGPSGADLFTTILSYQSPTRVTLATNATTALASRGALLGTDCGAGLQAAIAQIVAARGGTLLIDGMFYLETPVTQNFGTTDGISLTMQGLGWGTGILIAGNDTKDMVSIQNCPRLVIREVNFAGCPMGANDCRRVLNLASSEYILERCGFFGVSVAGPDLAGVVYARGCRNRHYDNEFGGCIASSGIGGCVVDIDNFLFVDIARDRFLDYGRYQGTILSKTGLGFCLSWLRIRNPIAASASVNNGSVVRVTDCNFDEGHFVGVYIAPLPERRIPQVHFRGNRSNNTLLDGGISFEIDNVDNLIMEQTSIGWCNTPHNGLSINNCYDVLIDGVYISDGAPGSPFTGKADGLVANTIRNLTLRNATAFKRRTFTAMGNVTEFIDGVAAASTFSKRGRVTDTDFINRTGAAPPVSTIAYDEANKKLYIKDRSLGWIATPAMAASTDATFFLANGSPTTGTLTGSDTYEKTSGAGAWNTTAYLTDTLTGGFRLTSKILVGTDVVMGVQNPTFPIPAGPNDFFVRLLLGGGQLYWGPDTTNWGQFPYTLGDTIELTYDPTAAAASQLTLKIAGVVKGTHATTAALNPSTQHRFSSSIFNVGGKFQLIDVSRYP